ncbi:cupin [Halovulum dunhuangense]|uniref:Cupin n=1 Tax=Halovulum dunhuangense TaxID=1505036 RepID=A0A849L136_9RHOB|nr:cupin domain-containing protein [Halovulum dunhuangense]NNU79974.1 cupin [Halovulum dunhuangense]
MRLNADFSQRVVIRPEDHVWTGSPSSGVERMMLDRIGEEVARATSLVRFAPGSRFSEHEHGGGEEFLVLDGVFSDESGDYPAGSYVRNPIGTAHSPHTDPGCTIFVKLRQFDPSDTEQFHVATAEAAFVPGTVPGMTELLLHDVPGETVRIVDFAPGTRGAAHAHPGGEEILVLSGSVSDAEGHYPAGSWIRNPPGLPHRPVSEEGCRLYIKSGHLAALV